MLKALPWLFTRWNCLLTVLPSGWTDGQTGQSWEEKTRPLGVSQGNILSVTLSTPASSFHRQGLLWIFGYSAFSLWPSTCKYKLQHCRGLPYDYLHHFLFPDPSFTQGWPNKDIYISLDPGNNLWGADRGEATEREFYQQQVFQQLVLWNPVEVVDASSSAGSIIVVNCLHCIALYFSLRFCGIRQVWNKRRGIWSVIECYMLHTYTQEVRGKFPLEPPCVASLWYILCKLFKSFCPLMTYIRSYSVWLGVPYSGKLLNLQYLFSCFLFSPFKWTI